MLAGLQNGDVIVTSENARREENYVRIRLMVFDLQFKADDPPAPKKAFDART
jgi:hypothetical protein